MMYDETTTVEQALAAWDAGDSIWMVEMGGLGPGYEQAIQVLAVELLRANAGRPLPETPDGWREWGDDVVHRLDSTGPNGERGYGFSGAQVGGAKNMAARMLKIGYGAARGGWTVSAS